MGLGDRIRGFFSKKNNPGLAAVEPFIAERKGIEGFIEPRTATQPTTLLLVDRDGDNIRAAVREPQDAAAFCAQHGIPVYDAQVIGYPQRMRDFEKRKIRGGDDSLDREIADLERRLSGSGDDPGDDPGED
ncbi:MAG: oxidoreductase [Actinomycetota bacterium]|nr:oxidoreductase [Actinomycetota bacterium]